MAEPHEFVAAFVPEAESHRLQAAEKGDSGHRLKERFRIVAALEIVVGNARTQMVDVMEADVPGEPLPAPSAACRTSSPSAPPRQNPIPPAAPIDALELVLHVKQPRPDRPATAMMPTWITR